LNEGEEKLKEGGAKLNEGGEKLKEGGAKLNEGGTKLDKFMMGLNLKRTRSKRLLQ